MPIKIGFHKLKIIHYSLSILSTINIFLLTVSLCFANIIWLKLIEIGLIIVFTVLLDYNVRRLIIIRRCWEDLRKIALESLENRK